MTNPAHNLPETADAEPRPAEVETLGNGWLLTAIFVLLTIGVLMLLVFASGGSAESSML